MKINQYARRRMDDNFGSLILPAMIRYGLYVDFGASSKHCHYRHHQITRVDEQTKDQIVQDNYKCPQQIVPSFISQLFVDDQQCSQVIHLMYDLLTIYRLNARFIHRLRYRQKHIAKLYLMKTVLRTKRSTTRSLIQSPCNTCSSTLHHPCSIKQHPCCISYSTPPLQYTIGTNIYTFFGNNIKMYSKFYHKKKSVLTRIDESVI